MFESLRDYVPGDDPADVAWKATARHGRLMTRNFETERSQNMLIVLDCGRLMLPQVDQLSRLDHAINASLLLSYVAMKQGDYIGLVAFSDRIESYVPPVKGRAALARMNEALYRLEARAARARLRPVCKFLALRHRKRSLIVILTDVIDKDASSMLLAYTARFARYHLPLCVTLRNLQVEGMAAAEPQSVADCLQQDGGPADARPPGRRPGPHAAVGRRRAGRRSPPIDAATAEPLFAAETSQPAVGRAGHVIFECGLRRSAFLLQRLHCVSGHRLLVRRRVAKSLDAGGGTRRSLRRQIGQAPFELMSQLAGLHVVSAAHCSVQFRIDGIERVEKILDHVIQSVVTIPTSLQRLLRIKNRSAWRDYGLAAAIGRSLRRRADRRRLRPTVSTDPRWSRPVPAH